MITISFCMIVKNEETVLERCLSTIKNIADEIIIIDTGSTDSTKQIAQNFTDCLYDFTWCDDFSKARNYSFSKATCDYCMWIDADDVLLEKDQQDLLALKRTLNKDTSVVMMRYHTDFDKNDKPVFTYYRERLLRRIDHFQWNGAIHEAITPSGSILYSDIAVTHKKLKPSDPMRNLNIFQKMIKEGTQLVPREQFYYARELYYHNQYKESYNIFRQFLDEGKGWKENNISACQFMAYCEYYLNHSVQALVCFFESFKYDTPRAEVCCDIGKHFLDTKEYYQSIYWYTLALSCKREDSTGGFIQIDCYDFIPFIQQCLCFYALGDYKKAVMYNEKAGKIKPDHPSYMYNKNFFKQLLNDSKVKDLKNKI